MFSMRQTAGGAMARRCWMRPAAALVAALAVTAGCAKKDPFGRQPLEGAVTWQGKPIAVGTITLEPAEGQPAGAKAAIREGKFSMPRESGPCPGKYNVWLRAFDHAGEDVNGPPPKEILPPQFRQAPATQVTIEKVDDKKSNTFNFDLK